MTAVVGYLQYLQKKESDRRDSRIAVLEVQVNEQSKRSDKFDVDIDNFKALLSDIRSDVSFIRGKMEKALMWIITLLMVLGTFNAGVHG